MRYKGFVCIGRILKSYGVKGEVVVIPETDYPQTLSEYKYFYIRYKGEERKLDIEKVRRSGRRFIFKFRGIESIEKARAIEGHYLFVKREELVEPQEEGYYIFDLEGLRAFNEKGEEIGVLETVMKGKVYDYFIILHKEGREIFLPGVKEYIKEIDFKKDRITVRIPEGL